MLGVQKLTALSDALTLRIHGELVHLQEKGETRTNSRPLTVYYTHHQVTQGYTHRGQLLGAAVGPGGEAQFVALDALFARGTVGAYFERIRRNETVLDAVALRRSAPYEHDTELIGGLRALLLRGAFSVSADVSRTYRFNRDFRENDRSWRTELRLGWSPKLEVRALPKDR
ncbi:MAG TPA: hypothetical protein VMS86_02930, partial [Thermoanaerobaculia bacterium]|nr:hypothetical protein [Thermoanaerobaculia bacterium]